MRILITRRESFELADGINIAVMRMAEEFLRRGHDVTCVSTVRSTLDTVRKVFACSAYPKFDFLLDRSGAGYALTGLTWLLRGRSIIRKHKPDVVLVQGAIPVRFPCPSIITCHDLERRKPGWGPARVLYKRFCYRLCSRIAATCSELRDALAAELRMDPARMAVIPNPMPAPDRPAKGFAEREMAVLHMGTPDYKKPLETLAAFAAIKETAAVLYITGKPDASLAAAVAALPPDVAARVRLLGIAPADELARLLGSVRCVCVPSFYEVPVLSPTVLESMAAGTPVVASPSISRDLVEPGVNCLVAGHLRERVENMKLLLRDEAAWNRVSREGLDTVRRFSPGVVADTCLRLACSLIDGPERSGPA